MDGFFNGAANMRNDEIYMQKALQLAKEARDNGEVPVGAVIVKDDKIIGFGKNSRETDKCALNHAEIIAIEQACENIGSWRLDGCTLYVTLEPCPMCAGAIINSRITRLVFGSFDEKAGACGSVINLLDCPFNHRPVVTYGILKEECTEILRSFFNNLRIKDKNKGGDDSKNTGF